MLPVVNPQLYSKLRERTTELRHKIAEENTVYNTPASDTAGNDTKSKWSSIQSL